MKKNLCLFLALAASSDLASAQVTEWVIAKGPYYDQVAEDTQPGAPTEWAAFATVTTTNVGDATSVTISGGGIPGSLALVQDGTSWEGEVCFPSQASLNAVFPSNTSYTITLSGGSLGTLIQQAPMPVEMYPNVPYLTGTVWTDIQAYNSSAPFTMTWNDPGPLTTGSGATVFDIYDSIDERFYDEVPGGAQSSVVPAGTLLASQSYDLEVIFTNETAPSGAGGFGIAGRVGHLVVGRASISTIAAAQLAFRTGGTNVSSYSAGVPILGASWTANVTLSMTGHSFARIVMHRNPAFFTLSGGQSVLVSGPRVLSLPLMPGPIATWTSVIPNDTSLAGLTMYTQALHLLGVSPFVLSNAQDLTFGS